MTAIAIETATVKRQSGRAGVRTDYVYTLASTDGWNHSRKAFRTLRSALREATSALTRPTISKTGPNTWKVTSSVADCTTIITRLDLNN